MNKKIIKMILTNSFKNDNRVLKEARTLVNNGYDVEVLAWDRENEMPNKEFEIIEGIKVKRFYIYSKYGSGIKQICGLLKFIFQVKKYLKNKKIDYLHCHDLDGGIVGVFIFCKEKILDLHEFYDNENLNKIRLFFQIKIGNYLLKTFNKIILCNDIQFEEYSKKTKKPILMLYNYPRRYDFKNFKYIEDEKKIRIRYSGVVRDYYSLSNLIKCSENIKNIVVYINGGGTELNKIKNISNAENIEVTGSFLIKELKDFYENTDLTYAIYTPNRKNNITGIPVKFYESLMLNIPIIALKNTVSGDIVDKYDIGFTIEFPIEKSLKNLLETISLNPKIVKEKKINLEKSNLGFCWETLENNFIKFYKN